MEEKPFSVAKEISRKIIEARFPDDLSYFDTVWQTVKKHLDKLINKPVKEWILWDRKGKLSGALGFADGLLFNPDLVRVMSVVNAVVLKVWPEDPQPNTTDLKKTVKKVMKELKTPKHIRDLLIELIAQLYGPTREEVLRSIDRLYNFITHEKEGTVKEQTLLKWSDSKDWNLWIRKSNSGIEAKWNGTDLNLSSQLRSALFLLAKYHGTAKSFDSFSSLIVTVKEEEKPKRLYTLKSRLSSALLQNAPELAGRITQPEYMQYGLKLASLKYCVSELIENTSPKD